MYRNMAKCKLCGTLLESKHRHDFVSCSCGSLSLDGGLAYRRVLWKGGEYDDVVENYYMPVTPQDVQVSANISAKERDNEQTFYQNLYNMLIEEDSLQGGSTNGEDNGQRPQNDICEREIPVRTPSQSGEEVGAEAQ